jgi:RNA polymerase sigma-70 factor (ECF subfamily)
MTDKRRRFEAQALPHLDAATNLARWLARPPLDADDIVQDAMLRAWRGFDSLRGTDVKPWLLTIVRNCFLTAAGKAKPGRETPLPDDDAITDQALVAADDPEQMVMAGDAARSVDGMLAALPAQFREVLVLREMEDMSYAEIAHVTGVPVGTVMSRLARARALLRQQWRAGAEGRPHVLQ